MSDLEKVQAFLRTYPFWDDGIWIDFLESVPGVAGLFPGGMEELSRQVDVQGNMQIACRYRFVIYRRTLAQQDGTENAWWMLCLQNWIQQQSAAGRTPHFGDVPEREWMQAQKGTLKEYAQTNVYTVTLIADFVKVYEVK